MARAEENTALAEGNPPPPAGRTNGDAASLPAVPEALPTVGGDVDIDADRLADESTANANGADDGEEDELGASESSDGGEEKEEVWVSAEV